MSSDVRIRQAEALLEQFGWDRDHSRQVRDLAVSLFDQLQPLHELGANERDVLNAAALLHDIGWTAGRTGHHKTSYALIQQSADRLPSFASAEVELIAQVARYHRKSLPAPGHAAFAELPGPQQRVVEKLAALLRLADGLDRPHLQAVRGLYCGVTDRHVLIGVEALTDPGGHVEGAARKRDLFERVYGLPVEFSVVAP